MGIHFVFDFQKKSMQNCIDGIPCGGRYLANMVSIVPMIIITILLHVILWQSYVDMISDKSLQQCTITTTPIIIIITITITITKGVKQMGSLGGVYPILIRLFSKCPWGNRFNSRRTSVAIDITCKGFIMILGRTLWGLGD